MEDNIRQLKEDYKVKKKEASSLSEKRQIKHNYREMKKKLNDVNKIIKKNNLLESTDEFWSKFDFPSIDDYKKNKFNVENDETIKETNEKIENSKQQYEEQNNHSDEVMRKADEIIKQIDKKLAELEKQE